MNNVYRIERGLNKMIKKDFQMMVTKSTNNQNMIMLELIKHIIKTMPWNGKLMQRILEMDHENINSKLSVIM